MSAAALLERLEGVRKIGAEKWIARCPSHEDHSPSLAIRECNDGTTLIHCFALCSATEVLAALGLELRDLFPARLEHGIKPKRRPFDPMDVLRCIAHEVQIVACLVADILNGKEIAIIDYERVQLAAERLHSAVEIAHGR